MYRKKNPVNGIECLCKIPLTVADNINSNSFAVPYMAAMLINGMINYIDIDKETARRIPFTNSADIPVFQISDKTECTCIKRLQKILMQQGYVGAFIMDGVENDCLKNIFDINSFDDIKLEIDYVSYITEADYIIIKTSDGIIGNVNYEVLTIEEWLRIPEDMAKELIMSEICAEEGGVDDKY